MSIQREKIAKNQEGKRLDRILQDFAPEFSRSKIQEAIRRGLVRVGGRVIKKTGFSLKKGQEIVFDKEEIAKTIFEKKEVCPEKIPLDVIYEDKDILVINKPAGLVVHPAAGNWRGTLVHGLLWRFKNGGIGVRNKERPGIVHRLDKDTSGVLVIAKNEKVLDFLQKQFSNRTIKKTYLALVVGEVEVSSGEGIIEIPLARSKDNRKKIAPTLLGKGREAITRFKILGHHKLRINKNIQTLTLVEVRPETGRTHQIRVHFAAIGHPVVGDKIYGNHSLNKEFEKLGILRQFLHAERIKIVLPEGRAKEFSAPLPSDLKDFLNRVKSDFPE